MKEESIDTGPVVVGWNGRARASQRVRRAVGRVTVAASLIGMMAFAACAKSPTLVLAAVSVDDTVPPVLQLRTIITRLSDPPADPSDSVTSMFSSLFHGDAADRPVAYRFPMIVQIGAPPEWSGPVQITVEGLDWDTNAVNATGTASAEVVANELTRTALTLTGVSIGGGVDGGVDASEDTGEGDDAAATDDAAPADDAAASI